MRFLRQQFHFAFQYTYIWPGCFSFSAGVATAHFSKLSANYHHEGKKVYLAITLILSFTFDCFTHCDDARWRPFDAFH